MFPVAPPKVELPADYPDCLADLKHRIQTERLRIVLASNAVCLLPIVTPRSPLVHCQPNFD